MIKKLEFFSSVPGLAETFPIKPSKEVIPKWAYAAKADYIKTKDRHEIHIFKCPGIFEMYTTGFIVNSWHDIDIETDGERFRMTIPDAKLETLLGKEAIQEQTHSGIAKFLPKRPWSCKSILKINTPWHVLAPKGVKLLMIPIPYSDYHDFESCIGILDPALSTEINVQGYWNNLSPGKHYIRAGTPLAQLIPITEKTLEFVVRDANQYDLAWLTKRSYLNYIGFLLNRSKLREAYDRMVTWRS